MKGRKERRTKIELVSDVDLTRFTWNAVPVGHAPLFERW